MLYFDIKLMKCKLLSVFQGDFVHLSQEIGSNIKEPSAIWEQN